MFLWFPSSSKIITRAQYAPGLLPGRAQYAPGLCVFTRAQYAPGLLPVRSMRQGYAFVSVYMCVCVCVCVCVWTKNTLVYLSPLEIRYKNALCCLFTEFIVLRRPLQRPERLDRAANRWFLIALWPSKSNIRYCGRIAQPKSRVRTSERSCTAVLIMSRRTS